jgi:hypothetical protein
MFDSSSRDGRKLSERFWSTCNKLNNAKYFIKVSAKIAGVD